MYIESESRITTSKTASAAYAFPSGLSLIDGYVLNALPITWFLVYPGLITKKCNQEAQHWEYRDVTGKQYGLRNKTRKAYTVCTVA